MPKQLRGIEEGDKAVVPYGSSTSSTFQRGSFTSATQNALTSALTLQRQMAHHQLNAAKNSDGKINTSTILCPKPYGMLSGGEHASWVEGDANIVLLLPSSSVGRFSDGGSKINDAGEGGDDLILHRTI